MNTAESRRVVVIAGPNGAGRSTCAPDLLRDTLDIREFVNADTIATGLAAFAPERVAIAAGRIMRDRLRELAESGVSFAFETTLSVRSYAPFLAELVEDEYEYEVVFLALPSPEVAVARVCERVVRGGHDIPVDTIRRRFERGLVNLFDLYLSLATTWRVFDNSREDDTRLVAEKNERGETIHDRAFWRELRGGLE